MINYFLFFFGLAFDFKGTEDGGNWFQLVAFSIAVISGIILVIRVRPPVGISTMYRTAGNLLVAALITTLPVALSREVEFDRYLRTIAPILLLVIGYFVGPRAIYQIGFQKTVSLMMAASSVAAVFTLFYGFSSTGYSVSEIRYQIISPMNTFLVSFLAYKIFFERRGILVAALLLIGILVIMLISATRSAVLAYMGTILFAVGLSRAGSFKVLIKDGIVSVTAGVVLGAILIPLFMQLMPEVMNRLTERIFSSEDVGFDVTTATRLAEIDFQIEAWLTDLTTFLFGLGVGASYGFSGEDLQRLVAFVGGQEQIQVDWWFVGHNMWVYSFFTQGLLFGWVIPFLLLYFLYVSWGNLVTAKDAPIAERDLVLRQARMCVLLFVAILLSTIGGNPLGSRMMSQYIGVIISVTIALAKSRAIANSSIIQSASTFPRGRHQITP